MIKILHNPRCSKSRAGVTLLEEKGVEFEIIKYLDDPLTPDELTTVIEKLGIRPLELVRKNEADYKEELADKELSDEEWILAMVENPRLIERPVVINGDKAVIGRPVEAIDSIL
ncbi:arsenate reductase (glutaredoxin) [Carboxylicivirga sp. A043]|uniref:arsenate reductase (glutaredoxin) n=1 Tax=Carboxylicivirga litoralis TaxID=2816963 RepID=UPI0021CB147A|nr:arsenate reductase (glutaredoxin) [Carboxylicivirga sp. A043]MCU4155152.1 arsenate reductase (glutaredoxin) [Carboxylicivirga sp. A043]